MKIDWYIFCYDLHKGAENTYLSLHFILIFFGWFLIGLNIIYDIRYFLVNGCRWLILINSVFNDKLNLVSHSLKPWTFSTNCCCLVFQLDLVNFYFNWLSVKSMISYYFLVHINWISFCLAIYWWMFCVTTFWLLVFG